MISFCSNSHINALSLAIKQNHPNIIIIEDDFEWTIKKSYVRKAFNYINQIFQNKEWDVIMLCHNNSKLKKTEDKFIYKVESAQTAVAYIVNNHYYNKLYDNIKTGYDNLVKYGKNARGYVNDQCWKSLQPKDKWYAINPMICRNLDTFSDIEQRVISYNLKPSKIIK